MMPTFMPTACLAARRRIPFPVLAAVVCLTFAAAGFAVLDDYGMVTDEPWQRDIAIANADYIMGNGDALPDDHNRFYGVAFELPLLMAERALELRDSRDIYLMRHLLTHWFFILGGFFCGLLVYKMFGSRWIALLAMLLFLLHPRLYAHSFFNSKDIPFTVMFVIALYLMHRSFHRDTVGAFALLGLVVGLAANMRPFGLLLPAMVLAMRGLDWRFASNPMRWKNILVTGGVFAAATLLAIYVSHPYYWENPLRLLESLQTLSQHPTWVPNLYMGKIISSDAVPPDYIPVWFGITTPTAALLLGVIGAAAVCWQGLRSPGLIFRPGELRFLFTSLGCFIFPIAVAIALEANTYNDWRHLYFLWVPFCLTAAAGLHWLAGKRRGGIRRNYFNPAKRTATYILAGAALAGAVTGIISLHPHQMVYFNSPAVWLAGGSIGERFVMDYLQVSYRQGVEHLLEQYPEDTLYMNQTYQRQEIFPAADRDRIVPVGVRSPDFYVETNMSRGLWGAPDEPVVYELRAYGSTYLIVSAPRLVWGAGLRPEEEVYRAAHQRVTAGSNPAAQSDFDVYIKDNVLYYIKNDCHPEDTREQFFLHVFPADAESLPLHRRDYKFDNRSFYFDWRGGFFDGKCITQEPLPDYAVTYIRTGQHLRGEGRELWQATINPSALARLGEIEASLTNSQPIAAGFFNLYQDDGQLVYYREACNADDTQARFFIHIFPADNNDLPDDRREYGFDNVGFTFAEYGARRAGKCLVTVPLPSYEIARIRTGQYVPGQGQLWKAEFPAAP